MKTLNFLILLLCFAICDSKVLVLTDKTFEKTIEKNPIVLVKFYAPWCGHCKTFAPEYKRLAAEVKKKSIPYVIAKLDATSNPKTANSQGVGSYPTVKLYLGGKGINYGGDRSTEAILEFIAKATGPFSTELKTVDEIRQKSDVSGWHKLNADRLVSILAGTDKENVEAFTKIGKKVPGYEYYNANPKLMAEVFPEMKQGNIVILKNFDEYKAMYTAPISEDALINFLKYHKDHVVNPINQEIVKYVFNTGVRTGVLLIHDGQHPDLAAVEEEFYKAALSMRIISFAYAITDIQKSWGARAANFLGIEECPKPMLVVVKKLDEFHIYRHEGELSKEKITWFLSQYLKVKLKRYFKSEEEPSENPGPIYKVVGKSFKKEVIKNDLDVLVKFHAPWCGQCKKLTPVLKALANSLKDNKKLKFVEIDATKNDVKKHPIKSYPTIKFFPGKNKKDVKVYNGDRSEDSLKKFIIEMTSYPELFIKKKTDL
eukprot:TRINITY_DN173_c0_g2_i1.p1 TRINITY_DN173_c0_g2~~TRINITY_DN173_c0_g2_i1.p1  ORF type:complete len:485 (+),score=123.69 TRINITY_DN173_c0_g2_i1:64-1518(+)